MADLRYSGPMEDAVKESIAAWIRDYLERNEESQADLAARTGVSEATISNIVLGKFKPGFKMCVRLHFGIGAPLNEVMRHTPTKAVATARPHTARHTGRHTKG